MKITNMTNLFVGYNKTENFKILICALDKEEAANIAAEYANDSKLTGTFEITEFNNADTQFDCDYVLTYAKEN